MGINQQRFYDSFGKKTTEPKLNGDYLGACAHFHSTHFLLSPKISNSSPRLD
jgi:hypothetical protein